MAAHPTPPHTPTTTTTTTTTPPPFPPLTATQARALLQTLLSTHPNPRPTPTTTTSNLTSKPSPPSNNQPPSSSPHPTITIDASTRIMGHANNIRLSAHNVHEAARVEDVMRAALSHTKPTGCEAAGAVNITIRTGMVLMGSRNVVVFGSGAGIEGEVGGKDGGKVRGGGEMVGEEGGGGRKRRAESEPAVVSRGKKVKVEKLS